MAWVYTAIMKKNNWYDNQEFDANKRLNLALHMRDKAMLRPTNVLGQATLNDNSALCGPGYESIPAPTTDPSRPRAKACCYGRGLPEGSEGTLVVIFRDNTWIEYEDVDVDTWEGLKTSGSTGSYLAESGLDGRPSGTTSYGQLPRK